MIPPSQRWSLIFVEETCGRFRNSTGKIRASGEAGGILLLPLANRGPILYFHTSRNCLRRLNIYWICLWKNSLCSKCKSVTSLPKKNLTQKRTSPNHQQPLTAFETYNGRSAFVAGTALHARGSR